MAMWNPWRGCKKYGYEVTKISIKEKYVLIHKIESGI